MWFLFLKTLFHFISQCITVPLVETRKGAVQLQFYRKRPFCESNYNAYKCKTYGIIGLFSLHIEPHRILRKKPHWPNRCFLKKYKSDTRRFLKWYILFLLICTSSSGSDQSLRECHKLCCLKACFMHAIGV